LVLLVLPRPFQATGLPGDSRSSATLGAGSPRRDYPLPEVCGGRGRTVRRDEVKRFWYSGKRKEVVREVPEGNARRSVFGVGPECMLFGLLFSSPVIVFAWLTHPRYVISSRWKAPFRIMGAALICVGLVFHLVSTRAMLRAFKRNELATTGAYGICRHPMYGAEIMAILPGIMLFAGMPLLLPVPAIIGLTFRFMMMKGEEAPLRETFGEEYLKYRAEVNAMFPTLSRPRRPDRGDVP